MAKPRSHGRSTSPLSPIPRPGRASRPGPRPAVISRAWHPRGAALWRVEQPVRVWLIALALVWALTLLATLAAATITPLASAARELLALRLVPATNPAPSLGRVLAIAAHNVQTAGWPLLL